MSKERDKFMGDVKDIIGDHKPSKEQKRVADLASKFYMNLKDGQVHKMVTKVMVMYISTVLPELSMKQASELNLTVHSTITTVLSYLVEDGLIKE